MSDSTVLREIERQLKETVQAATQSPHEGVVVATLRLGGAVFRGAFRVVDGTVEALVNVAAPPDPRLLEVVAERVSCTTPLWARLVAVGDGARKTQWRLAGRWPAKEASGGLQRFLGLAAAVAEAAEALADEEVAHAYIELCGREDQCGTNKTQGGTEGGRAL